MNLSTYADDMMQQITVSADHTERRALMTRLKGKRTWSVRGRVQNSDGRYDLVIATAQQKARALAAARDFVEYYCF
jgi:hypothetical protein